MLKALLISAAILALPGLVHAQAAKSAPHLDTGNWGLEHDADYDKSQGICRTLGEPEPPEADRPSKRAFAALNGCDSEALYYGQNGKPDYVQARKCAFRDIEEGGAEDGPFTGETILMQVYANGLGVARNPRLATQYACDIDGAPAERNARVLHMQATAATTDRIDYCDDITSGMSGGVCADRDATLAGGKRDDQLALIAARLPPAAKPLYTALKTRLDAFIDAHGGGEVDLSGTARGQMEIAEEEAVRSQFLKDLQRLVAGKWPAGSAADAKVADAQLNATYRRAMAGVASKLNYSTVTADEIKEAERAWLAYRDAYLAFAAAAAPSLGRDAVLARLTRLRIAELEGLPFDLPS